MKGIVKLIIEYTKQHLTRKVLGKWNVAEHASGNSQQFSLQLINCYYLCKKINITKIEVMIKQILIVIGQGNVIYHFNNLL